MYKVAKTYKKVVKRFDLNKKMNILAMYLRNILKPIIQNMKTVKMLNNKNRNVRIQEDDLGDFHATTMINIDQVLKRKEFKTLNGAIRFANKHLQDA